MFAEPGGKAECLLLSALSEEGAAAVGVGVLPLPGLSLPTAPAAALKLGKGHLLGSQCLVFLRMFASSSWLGV